MRICVVLPTFNESLNIDAMLSGLTDSPLRPDVLVVDDSSPDGTADIVREWESRPGSQVKLISRQAKNGLGAAYRAGFRYALDSDYDVLVQMDADGSHPIDALPLMLAAVDAGADLVIGSRYVPGGLLATDWPRHRRWLSIGANTYARGLLGVGTRDLTGGFKMWTAPLLASIDLQSASAAGYAFQIQTNMLAHRRHANVVEVPITFTERTLGESKMSGRIVVEALLAVLRLRRRDVADQPVAKPTPTCQPSVGRQAA